MEERRFMLALALSIGVLLVFRMWTDARYPQGPLPAPASPAPVSPAPSAGSSPATQKLAPTSAPTPPPQRPLVTADERRVEIANETSEIAFTSKGARLLSWKLLSYKDDRGRALEAHPGGNPVPGPLDLVTGRSDIDARLREARFRVEETGDPANRAVRFDFSDGALEATKTLQSIKGGRAFRIDATVKNNGESVPVRWFWGPGFGQPTDDEKGITGYLQPQFVALDRAGNETRLQPSSLGQPTTTQARIAGVESKYFAVLFAREDGSDFEAVGSATSGETPAVEIKVQGPLVLAVAAKEYDELKALDLGLEQAVPVGSWIGPIVVPLFRALRAVESRVGNYGIAITLLTIGIAVALSPFRHFAIVSSAKMAKVGPQIRAVQERYRRLSLTDPKRQQMQQEIAEVYQKNGIDMVRQTAAGCLPTLLTMPFLFAFYRMLDISVALKGAPFLWIPDLSLKDPLFITPLLSGLSMIGMQKIMPAPAVDPAQQRMMLMMPIIFSAMFAWAPAGLNLYWFVSNVCAMVQQALVMYFAPHLFPRTREAS